jgi:hypothetical protein
MIFYGIANAYKHVNELIDRSFGFAFPKRETNGIIWDSNGVIWRKLPIAELQIHRHTY